MKSAAIVFTAPNKAELQTVDIPPPGPGEVVVDIHFSCLSPGTEGRVLSGKQTNAPAFPLIPGYSASGLISEVGQQSQIQVGTPVFITGGARCSLPKCWGAHIGRAVVAESAVVVLPRGVSLRDAAALKLWAIAAHGMRLGECRPGEHVAVLGLGPIGFFSSLLHQNAGTEVAVSDLLPERIKLATAKGLSSFSNKEVPFLCGADIVVDATGAPSVLSQACTLLRERPWDNQNHPRTRLLIQGSYSNPPTLPYDILFQREPLIWVPRDNQRCDIETVIQLMDQKKLPMNDLLADLGSPENAPAIYRDLHSVCQDAVTGVFNWHN